MKYLSEPRKNKSRARMESKSTPPVGESEASSALSYPLSRPQIDRFARRAYTVVCGFVARTLGLRLTAKEQSSWQFRAPSNQSS
jgi:hypothetical protein